MQTTSVTTELKDPKLVLLIDNNEIDNFINRKVFEEFAKATILEFTSTTAALNYFKQADTVPELILLDIHFPVMDGFEFLREFEKLEIAKDTKGIFILSATLNPSEINYALQKCAGFIEKPLTREKLFLSF